MADISVTLRADPVSGGLTGLKRFKLTGSGFPAAPTVAKFIDFNTWPLNKMTTAANTGAVSALYGATGAGSYPAINQLGTKRGIAHHNASDALVGLSFNFGAVKDFLVAWQMGIPNGKFASGAYYEEEFPNAAHNATISCQKLMWWNTADGGADPRYADVVCASRNSENSWATVGNQTPINLNFGGNNWDWDVENSFEIYHKTGANPFLNNGVITSELINSHGVSSNTRNNAPLFKQIVHLTPTVQNSTAYTVNIPGFSPITITSDPDATLAEILSALITKINTDQTAYSAASSDGGARIKLVPLSALEQTITASANIEVYHLLPQYLSLDTIWMGNGNQTNTQAVQPYMYVAIGTNCGNRAVLSNSATFSSRSKSITVDFESWSSSEILTVPLADPIIAGLTHWHVLTDGVPTHSGVLV
jgi:hypothetical protein